MARPRAKELTERELEVMQVFWKQGEMRAVEARDRLAALGLDGAIARQLRLSLPSFSKKNSSSNFRVTIGRFGFGPRDHRKRFPAGC